MFSKRVSKIFWSSFIIALIVHVGLAFFFYYSVTKYNHLDQFQDISQKIDKSIKLDDINFITEPSKMKKVGIKGGVKDANRPDLTSKGRPTPSLPTPPSPPVKPQKLSLDNLAPDKIVVDETKKNEAPLNKENNKKNNLEEQIRSTGLSQKIQKEITTSDDSSSSSHFYYNSKKGGVISRSREQDVIKTQASKETQSYVNPAMSKISNFEIRYDRPEGVSEDELNSDEKAYYSFYVRSYKNYFTKIYANYEKILLERPALVRAFDSKHLLIGKIDYDENGDIIKVKIIKSSDNDDLHYFFEETLKQLTQPNPPKVFIKNKKEFSIYYQLQIN